MIRPTTCALALAFFATTIQPPPAAAATATGSLGVSAAFLATCTISNSTMDFGNTLPGRTVTSQADVIVNCTNGDGYNLSADGGLAGDNNVRKMQATVNGQYFTVPYQLYTDANRSTVFGRGVQTGVLIPGTGTGQNQSVTIYGSSTIPPNGVPYALLTDSVTLSVIF